MCFFVAPGTLNIFYKMDGHDEPPIFPRYGSHPTETLPGFNSCLEADGFPSTVIKMATFQWDDEPHFLHKNCCFIQHPLKNGWLEFQVGVSKNRGTPKWMVKIMENPIKMG